MRSEDLVAGADEVVTIESLHIDQSVGGIVNAVESNLCTSCVGQRGDGGHIDDGSEGMRGNGAGDKTGPRSEERRQVFDCADKPTQFRCGLDLGHSPDGSLMRRDGMNGHSERRLMPRSMRSFSTSRKLR